MKRGDTEKVFEVLEKFLPYAIKCDVPTSYRHSSILFKGIPYDSSKVIRFSKNNQCKAMIKLLKSELFDSIRSDPRFITIYKRLSEYAN